MKLSFNKLSLLACLVLAIVFFQQRLLRSDLGSGPPLKITTWDSFGYYAYLPGIFIYHDLTKLEWIEPINDKYDVIGGDLYQASLKDNGNYVFKYLGGIALLQTPWFLIGHFYAINSEYEADGFSQPYQWALAIGSILYALLGFIILRALLLKYFNDRVVAITILSIGLATNLIQYVTVDSAMSHSYIFLLYSLVLYGTFRWHSKPSIFWASVTGLVIGIATISRPTEAIMVFIPILWATHNKASSKKKWALVRKNRKHLYAAAIFGILGILPQLIYWKFASGSFIHNVGSKWVFLNPWFRVLFGWTNGWFIYTPVTLFFIAGLFFLKPFPFRKSAIVFCLLNIWIVISWFDWKYGATYSTRALVQSYPVFALPFAAIISKIDSSKLRIPFLLLIGYLIFVNFIQLDQYYKTILHFRDMNRKYYASIYLDRHPTALDMSLLDTSEILENEDDFDVKSTFSLSKNSQLSSGQGNHFILIDTILPNPDQETQAEWLQIESSILVQEGFDASYLSCSVQLSDSVKENFVRLNNPMSSSGQYNAYEFFYLIPDVSENRRLKIQIKSEGPFRGDVEKLEVNYLVR